jgi:hypothetical protein
LAVPVQQRIIACCAAPGTQRSYALRASAPSIMPMVFATP